MIITSEQYDFWSIGNFKEIRLQFHKYNKAPTQNKVLLSKRSPR